MGLIDKVFNYLRAPIDAQRAEFMAGTSTFTPFSGSAYESSLYRSAVHAIATNGAKLKGRHIVYSKHNDQRQQGDPALNRLLEIRPNPYMSAYDMIYKLITHYHIHNNAFAYLQKDNSGNLTAIYPLITSNVEFVTDTTGKMYMRFLFGNGEQVTLHMSEVMILRRHFNSNDLLGDSNTAISNVLDLAHIQDEGLKASVKNSAHLQGILRFNQALAPAKLKEEKEAFQRDYLNMSNSGGVAVVDSKAEYTPLGDNRRPIENHQIETVKRKIYDYLGVGESIVNGTYTEDEWSAFYESTIEPLALQMSQELTEKVFTQREQAFGNRIIFEANRLQFASNESKTQMLKELVPMGLLTINQALEILNLPPVEDGNKHIQSLNYIDKDIAKQYQMNGGDGDEGNETHRSQG